MPACRLIKTVKVSFSVAMYALIGLLIISATVSGSGNSRIVGGHDAEDGKYPYQVSIRTQNFPICGGSIISHYYILTAAHCIYHKLPTDITVVMGTNYLLNSGIIHTANKLICHDEYDETRFLNDIGVIRVNGHIEYNKNIQPIILATQFYVPPGENATITGWGKLYYESPKIPNALQAINVTVIPQEMCQQMYWQVTKNNICTFTKKNQGTCNGDSGGPLVIQGKQIGIVSYGVPCAKGYPDVYTRVHPYKMWMAHVMTGGVAGAQVNLNILTGLLLATSTIASYLYPLA